MRCQAHDQARGIAVRCKDRATFVVEAGRNSINLCDEHYARCTGRNFNFWVFNRVG